MSVSGTHTLRVAWDLWSREGLFSELLELLKKYPCETDSVALFTSSTHPPLPLEELSRRTELAKATMKRLREAGFSAGINILGTIGHHEEDLENSLSGDYSFMTGQNGEVCRGSYCMNDGRFLREFVVPTYELLADAHPDFIWIDDDIRYGHMPIGNGCFCDGCVRLFNEKNGTDFTRESLVRELNGENTELRRLWLRHNSGAITRLFRLISRTVRSRDENITLGFMTGERYVEGYAFEEFARALSEDGKYEIMWRPGGGAYTDYCFDEIVRKIGQVGRQCALLPSFVTVIREETENFPYQLLKKTPTSTALEGAWSMTAGCTGAALNILPSEAGEPLEVAVPHLRAINRLSPFYRYLRDTVGGKQPFGIGTAWGPDSQAALPRGEFVSGWGGKYADFAEELFDFGLPQAYAPQNSCVTLVHGNAVSTRTEDEARMLLSGGVYMDALALEVFDRMGLGSLTGFGKGGCIPVDAREKYLPHELNRGFEGGLRNCRQAFNPGDSFALVQTDPSAEALACLTDYHGGQLCPVSHGLFENALGGRISVGGYYPFGWISDSFKTLQLKRLMVRLSGGTLPSYVETYCRIRNHSFVENGRCTVALLNPTNESLEDLVVAVRSDRRTASLRRMNGETVLLTEHRPMEEGYCFFRIPCIPPYEMAVIEA